MKFQENLLGNYKILSRQSEEPCKKKRASCKERVSFGRGVRGWLQGGWLHGIEKDKMSERERQWHFDKWQNAINNNLSDKKKLSKFGRTGGGGGGGGGSADGYLLLYLGRMNAPFRMEPAIPWRLILIDTFDMQIR